MASVVWTHGAVGAVHCKATGDSTTSLRRIEAGAIPRDTGVDGRFCDLRVDGVFRGAFGERKSA